MTGACDAPATLSWADRAKAQAAAPAAAAAASAATSAAPKKPAAKMSWVDFARCTPPALPMPAAADDGSVVAAPYTVVAGKAAARRKGGSGGATSSAASKKAGDASSRSPYEIFSDQPVPTSPATPAVVPAAEAAAAAGGSSSSGTNDTDAAAAAAATPPQQQLAAGSKKKEKKSNSKKEKKKKKAEADEAAAAAAEAEAAAAEAATTSTLTLQEPETPAPSTPPTQPAAAAADTATHPEAAAADAAATALEPAPEADAEEPEQQEAATTGGSKKKKKKKKKKGTAAAPASTPADAAAGFEPPATPPPLPSPPAGGERKQEQDPSLSPVSLCSPATPVGSDRGRLVAEAFAHDSDDDDDDDDFYHASAAAAEAQPQAAAATQPTASLLAIQEDHVPTPAAPQSPPAHVRQDAAGPGSRGGGKKGDESSPSPSTAAAAAARTPSGDGSPVSLVGGDSCGPSSAGSFQDVSAAAAAAAAARRQYSTTCLPTCLTMDSLKDDDDYNDLPSGQQAVAAAAAAAAAAAQATSAGEFPSPCQYIPLRPVCEAEELLRVRVTQARRVTGEGRLSHWMYRTIVRTRSAMYAAQPQVDGGAEVEVEKRYSDFAWLHATLTALYPSVPVPPIPTAAAAGTMDKVIEYFSPESSTHAKALDDPAKLPLVQERLHLLALFCGHLGASPLFAASELLRRFLLTPSGPELEAFKRHTTQRIGEGLLLGESTEEADRAAAAGHATGSAATAAAWVGRLYHTIRGDGGDGGGGGDEARARMPAHVLQKREKTAVTREALGKMHRACEGALRAEAANRKTATAMLAGQGFLASRTAAKASACPEDDAAAGGGGGGGSGSSTAGATGLSLTPVSSILDPLALWANLSRSVPLLGGGGGGGGDEAFTAAKAALPASSSLLRLPADSPGDPSGSCGGGAGASSAATTLTTLSAQIGCRVVDATGHGGTVRWAGTLAMAPLADLTYIGVEWDEKLHGQADGTIFGEKKFDCKPGHGSFTPPNVLYTEPTAGHDTLMDALGRVLRETEIELAGEEADREGEMLRLRDVLGFWTGVADAWLGALRHLESLYALALHYESQGAADGRSPELARVSALISTAEAHLSCEWEHYQEAYRAAGVDIVQAYTDLFAPKPHPYGPMLSRWVSYIPDITNDPAVPATDLFAEPFIPAL